MQGKQWQVGLLLVAGLLLNACGGGGGSSAPATPTLTALEISPAGVNLNVGDSQTLIATGKYSDGSSQNLTTSVSWDSTAPNIASVSAGAVNALSAGTATINATMASVNASVGITVTPLGVTLTSIAVTPTSAILSIGHNQPVNAMGTYSDGSSLDITASALWNSNNTVVATVNAGVVSALAPGSATISVSNGTISASVVITVADGKIWYPAHLLETDDQGNANEPRVVVDAANNAVAVWSKSDGTNFQILSSRYTPVQGWSIPGRIDNITGDATQPQLALDSAGNVIAVWQQDDGTGSHDIYANRYDINTGWGIAGVIETTVGDATMPQIAVHQSGNAIAVWQQRLPTNNLHRIRAAVFRYDAVSGTGVWQPSVGIVKTAIADTTNPQIAVDTNGNAFAVWAERDSPTADAVIWLNGFTPKTGWLTAIPLSTGTGTALNPQIGFDPAGDAIALWTQFDGTRDAIMGSRYITGVAGANPFGPIDDIVAGNSSSPRIAFDYYGNAIATWVQDGNLLANRYDNTKVSWQGAQAIETDAGIINTAPAIAMDPTGNATAIWLQPDDLGNVNVRANHYWFGTGWGSAELVAIGSPNAAASAAVAVTANGDALVVWSQLDIPNNYFDIWTNLYQ
jgi:hypothetical protein